MHIMYTANHMPIDGLVTVLPSDSVYLPRWLPVCPMYSTGSGTMQTGYPPEVPQTSRLHLTLYMYMYVCKKLVASCRLSIIILFTHTRLVHKAYLCKRFLLHFHGTS
jgi:hypothetical protein